MAQQLNFTDRQAQAILDMRLYKLIGLEIEALMKEHEETLKNISKYEDILDNCDSMAEVIIKELDQIKKEYGRKRKTSMRMQRKLFMKRRRWRDGSLLPDGSFRIYASH